MIRRCRSQAWRNFNQNFVLNLNCKLSGNCTEDNWIFREISCCLLTAISERFEKFKFSILQELWQNKRARQKGWAKCHKNFWYLLLLFGCGRRNIKNKKNHSNPLWNFSKSKLRHGKKGLRWAFLIVKLSTTSFFRVLEKHLVWDERNEIKNLTAGNFESFVRVFPKKRKEKIATTNDKLFEFANFSFITNARARVWRERMAAAAEKSNFPSFFNA